MRLLKIMPVGLLVMGASSHFVCAADLAGWNDFRFNSTRGDVEKASNGTAVLMSDGSMSASDWDVAGLKAKVEFQFDFAPESGRLDQQEDPMKSGSLTRIGVEANKKETCEQVDAELMPGFHQKYGRFLDKSVPAYGDITDRYGGKPDGVPDKESTSYQLKIGHYHSFDNETFMIIMFSPKLPSRDTGRHPLNHIIADCDITITYSKVPPRSPGPPKMKPQGL